MRDLFALMQGRFPQSLVRTESGGNFRAQNSERGSSGRVGHFGRLQFGRDRLDEAMAAGAIPPGTTPQAFMASPEMQASAEKWHFGDIDKFIQKNGFDQRIGQTIGGVPITVDGMRAVAHLGGKRGLEQFINTGGQYNPTDANKTSLFKYFQTHAGNSPLMPTSATAPVAPQYDKNNIINQREEAPLTLPFNTGAVPQMVPPRIDMNNYKAEKPAIGPQTAVGMALPGMTLNTAPSGTSLPSMARPVPQANMELGPGGSGGAAGMAPSPDFKPEAEKGFLDKLSENKDVTSGLEGIMKGLGGGKQDQPMQITPLSNYSSEQAARATAAQGLMAQLLHNKRMRGLR